MQRPVGTNQHAEGVDNIHTHERPSGTSKDAALRRLRKDRPDLDALNCGQERLTSERRHALPVPMA